MNGADQMFAEAADKLKETVRQGLTFDAAQVKVVGLDDIRRTAGAHWPSLADRIRANSMSFLEGCLEPGDIVIPCGDGFLVIYAHAEGRDLDRECGSIQDMLNAFYLGTMGMENLQTRVSGQRIPADHMALILAPVPEPEKKPEHRVVFLPAWSAAREAVGIYLATAATEHGIGYSASYRESGQHDDEDFSALDSKVLQTARKAVEDGDQSFLVSVCVHATTMAHRERRRAFLAQLSAIPEATRKFMLARIAEIAPGTPVLTLADWAHQIRPFTPRVALELHASERTIEGFDGVGAWSVGCFLPDAQQTIDLTARHTAMIKRWTAQAHRQKLKIGFVNLNHPALILAACSEGVDMIGSDRIWPALPHPDGLKPFSTIRLRRALAQMGAPGRRPMAASAARAELHAAG